MKCNARYKNDPKGKKICAEPSNHLNDVTGFIVDAAHGYDAMWLAARAMNATENIHRLARFNELDRKHMGELTSSMYNYSVKDTFNGASVSYICGYVWIA